MDIRDETIKNLLATVEEKDKIINTYISINETNKIIIEQYKDVVELLRNDMGEKDDMIDKLTGLSDKSRDIVEILLEKIKNHDELINNLRTPKLN